MELIYSVRRAPLTIDPPYLESLNGGPTLCVLSNGNIVAFTSITKLVERSADSWGSHVYLCDINTPWETHLVASYEHQVSALEWDGEGKYLLVGTSAGDIDIYASCDFLLDSWQCLHSAKLPGEHIIKGTFFHNGRRLVMLSDKKSEQLPITERLQYTRIAPTMRGFGGTACEGGAVVTASGMVAAFNLPAPDQRLQLVADSLRTSRSHIVTADVCYSNDGKLLVAACGSAEACVRCYRVALRRVPGASSQTPVLTVQPLPSFYLRENKGMSVRLLRWWLREDTDTLLVSAEHAGPSGRTCIVDAWTLTDRALPLHALCKPPQGKSDCFNTVEWRHAYRWSGGATRVTSLSCSRGQLTQPAAGGVYSTYVVIGCSDNALHLLYHNLNRVCSTTLVPSGGGTSEAAANTADGATPPKIPKRGAVPTGVPSAVVSGCELSCLGGVLLCIDTHSQLHLYKTPRPASDLPAAVVCQQMTSLLEYALVSGVDYVDILLTLKPNLIEPVYERITETFQRQPAPFQQYHFFGWLSLRAALCRLMPDGQQRASDLTCLLLLHATGNAFKSLLRSAEMDDKTAADSVAALLQDDAAAQAELHKAVLMLEAKEFAVEPAALQSLRRLVQRVADIALALLASLPIRHVAKQSHNYSASDINLLRQLLVTSRVWGLLRAQALPSFARAVDSGETLALLYRLLGKLVARPTPAAMDALREECATLPSQVVIPRVWESPPRCCVAAPHGQNYPLYFQYEVEPEGLRYSPEPPTLEGVSADTDLDSIRYIHLGAQPARVRACKRCGARTLAADNAARTHAQRAWDMRWQLSCRCGGRWSMQVNT